MGTKKENFIDIKKAQDIGGEKRKKKSNKKKSLSVV